MTDTIDSEAAVGAGPRSGMAGASLRAAREAAGLSVDAVAQQLKLAPRQVTALEEEDFQRLPGRTFVRGFARNYARCVHLDPEAVLALLPAPESAPALDRPMFAAARRPMGEIPVERIARPSSARWLFALLLAVVIVAAGYYEYTRQQTAANRDPEPVAVTAGARAPAGPPGAAATSAPAASSSADAGTLTTALPNPVSDSTSPGSRVEAKDGVAATSPGTTATKDAAAAVATPLVASDAALVLTFKGTSWAEVKDAHGRVILQMTGGAGMTQTVSGTAPLELALGNAPDVAVTFRGQALDLSPYTRGNVARVALK